MTNFVADFTANLLAVRARAPILIYGEVQRDPDPESMKRWHGVLDEFTGYLNYEPLNCSHIDFGKLIVCIEEQCQVDC